MIKNIVFDIGNVLLYWRPLEAVSRIFPHQNAAQLTQLMFKSPPWLALNKGQITEKEIIEHYHETLNIDLEKLCVLMQEIKYSLTPIDENFALLNDLYHAKYNLYALTDNVPEIMIYLKEKYQFWDKFKGVIVSADVGYLKPAPEIYQCLFNTYNIQPVESIFIDDHLPNVEGARNVGMQSIQFIDPEQCSVELYKILK